MTDITSATAAVINLISTYGETRDQMVQVLTAPADAGANGDGMIDVTTPNGSTIKVRSLAAATTQLNDTQSALIGMATNIINLQTLVVNRWNEEDAK